MGVQPGRQSDNAKSIYNGLVLSVLIYVIAMDICKTWQREFCPGLHLHFDSDMYNTDVNNPNKIQKVDGFIYLFLWWLSVRAVKCEACLKRS